MNNHSRNSYRFYLWILVLIIFFLNSCSQKNIPPELIGQWKTGKVEITVRNRPESRKYEYTKDTVTITLIIDSNYTASGFIGSVEFKTKIKGKSASQIKRTWWAYSTEVFVIEEIFANYPKTDKGAHFLLGPMEGTTMKSELKNLGFPMAKMIFTKEEY